MGISATWLPSYLQLGLGYKQVQAGWILSAIYIFQSRLLLVGGWITERLLRRGWSRRICFGTSSGIVMIFSALALQLATLAGGNVRLVLIALAFAAPTLTSIAGPMTLGAIAPPAQRGNLIVVIYSANTISALFSNATVGWIVQQAAPDIPVGFAHAMSFTAGILLVGGLASFALMRPERTIARFSTLINAQTASGVTVTGSDVIPTV